MSRKTLSDADRAKLMGVLDQLKALFGADEKTAKELGVSVTTMSRWRNGWAISDENWRRVFELSQSAGAAPRNADEAGGESVDIAKDLDTIMNALLRLTQNVNELRERISRPR